MDITQITAQYTPRVMIEAMVQNPRPSTFLLSMFAGRVETHDTEVIEIDVEKGGQTMAAYVARTSDPNTVGKKDFSTNLHAIPYIYENIEYTSADVKTRSAGETIYEGGSAGRLDAKVGKWLGTLDDRIIRREEYQVAEALQTGKVTVTGNGVSYVVNFGMNPDHLVVNSGTSNWGSTTEDKIAQLETGAKAIADAGAPTPTVLLLDRLAAADFLADEAVLKYLDNRRVTMGEINIKQLSEQRATYLGSFSRIGLSVEIYVYNGTYTNEAGETKGYLADNTAILTTPQAMFKMHYGLIENLKSSFVGRRFPDMTLDNRGRNGEITMESAPLFAAHQPDAIYTITTKS